MSRRIAVWCWRAGSWLRRTGDRIHDHSWARQGSPPRRLFWAEQDET